MNNRKYIEEKFENDGIRAPESLSEDSILKMLEKADEAPAAKASADEAQAANAASDGSGSEKVFAGAAPEKRTWIRPENRKALAVAAAAVIAIFGIAALSPLIGREPDTSVKDGELYEFRSTAEIEKLVKSLDKEPVFRVYEGGNQAVEDVMDYESDVAMNESAEAPESKSAAGASGQDVRTGSHSETYLQVEDVDEADIVKTDGRYIYYVNKAQEVVILEAKDGKTKKLASIGNNGVENYVGDIFLSGDRLVTVGTVYRDDEDEGSTGIVVYDISDRSRPKVLYDFSQTGDIVSSRMVGDCVYLVTNYCVRKGGHLMPACGPYDDCKELGLADIRCMPDPQTASYIVLSAVDIASGSKGKTATKAVFGASSDIYCNDHALYSASGEWDEDTGVTYTRIAKAVFNGLDIRFENTARVRGAIVNQFSMDENDGYFRIATTSQRNGIDVNNLYVLDGEFREAGKLTGFARNESIKSVRFMGSKAYVITYQAIDPLFVIDLADPADPRIEGEVKIDGFSTLLIPVSEGRLLGIGHATGDNGYGGEYDSGLKLALFDISDPSEPKVIDSKEFENMTSPAQSDHRALTVNADKGWYAIPYDIYNYEDSSGDVVIIEDAEEPGDDATLIEDAEGPASSEEEAGTGTDTGTDTDTCTGNSAASAEDYHQAGVLVFRTDDKIDIVDQHEIEAAQLFRSVFIEDWIYALDANGVAGSFIPE